MEHLLWNKQTIISIDLKVYLRLFGFFFRNRTPDHISWRNEVFLTPWIPVLQILLLGMIQHWVKLECLARVAESPAGCTSRTGTFQLPFLPTLFGSCFLRWELIRAPGQLNPVVRRTLQLWQTLLNYLW